MISLNTLDLLQLCCLPKMVKPKISHFFNRDHKIFRNVKGLNSSLAPLAGELWSNLYISVVRGGQGAIPHTYLAYLTILCFEKRCPKQNAVAHLKSNILPPQNFATPPTCTCANWACAVLKGIRCFSLRGMVCWTLKMIILVFPPERKQNTQKRTSKA